MSYPTGYNPNPTVPRIVITDLNGVLKYVYESESIATNKTQLKLWMHFNNENVSDFSPEQNHGTVIGTAEYADSPFVKGFKFNGTNYITIPNESDYDFDFNQAFSISFWLYMPSGLVTTKSILCKTNDWVGTTDVGWGIGYTSANNRIFMRFWDGTNNMSRRSSDGATFDAWHHYVFTKSTSGAPSGTKVYRDGVDVTTADLGGTLTATILNNRTPTIGAESDASRIADPNVIIDDVQIYNYELSAADVLKIQAGNMPGASAQQDFSLSNWFVHRGKNTDHGRATLLIDDLTNSLIDITTSYKEPKIKNQWIVKISLGKSASGIALRFLGRVYETEVIRPQTNDQQIRLFVIGEGIRNTERITKITRYQKKTADGITFDDTDGDAKVSAIFRDVLEDTDHHPQQGLGGEGWTFGGIQDIDVKLPDFQKNFVSWGMALQELANYGAGVFGFKPSKDAYFRIRQSVSSGILFSNDGGSLLTQGWDMTKFGVVRNNPMTWKDTSIDYGYSIYHGIGSNHDSLDWNKTTSNALLDLTTKWFAFKFNPLKDNISKLAPFLSKTGTITKPLTVSIVGDSGAGPDEDDIRGRIVIYGDRLQRELASARYFEVSPFTIKVSKNETLWMIIDKMAQVTTEHVDIDYQTGSGVYYDSTDGLAWTARTGEAKFREYHSIPVHLILENTTARSKFGIRETVIPLGDFPDEDSALAAISGLAEAKSRLKRIYSQIEVSLPDIMPEPGETAKLVDVFNGLNTIVEISAWETGSDSSKEIGATIMKIDVEEFHF